jgi:uncharacterized protein (TIGR03382 family)
VVPDEQAPDGYLLWSGPHSYAIQVAPGLRPAGCSVWAYDAMRGGEHRGLGGHLFGDRDSWLSWHWRQLSTGAAGVVVVAVLGLVVLMRRRRETRLTA